MDTSRTNAIAGFEEPSRKPASGNVREGLANFPGAGTPVEQAPAPHSPLAVKASAMVVAAAGLAVIGLMAGDGLPAGRSAEAPTAETAAQTTTQLAGSWLAPGRAGSPKPSSARAGGVNDRGPTLPCPCRCPNTNQDEPSPPPRSGATQAPGPAPTLTSDGKVILNTAGATELTRLPGVGSKRALKILELRQRLQRFRKPTDLLRIKGIGVKSLRKMLPHLLLDPPTPATPTVSPSASVSPQPTPPEQEG